MGRDLSDRDRYPALGWQIGVRQTNTKDVLLDFLLYPKGYREHSRDWVAWAFYSVATYTDICFQSTGCPVLIYPGL